MPTAADRRRPSRHARPISRRTQDDAPEPVAIADAPSLVPPIEHATAAGRGRRRDRCRGHRNLRRPPRSGCRRAAADARARRAGPRVILVLVAFNVALVGCAQRSGALSAADRLALCRDRPAGQSAQPEIRERQDFARNAGRRHGAGRRGHHRRAPPSKPVEVPRLRFAVRNATGQEIYTWTALPSRSILGPGETLPIPQPARLAAGGRQRRHGALLQRAATRSPERNERPWRES